MQRLTRSLKMSMPSVTVVDVDHPVPVEAVEEVERQAEEVAIPTEITIAAILTEIMDRHKVDFRLKIKRNRLVVDEVDRRIVVANNILRMSHVDAVEESMHPVDVRPTTRTAELVVLVDTLITCVDLLIDL